MKRKIPMHNYLKKQLQIVSEMRLEHALYIFDIRHDEWCQFLRFGYRCNCDPDVTPIKVTEENAPDVAHLIVDGHNEVCEIRKRNLN